MIIRISMRNQHAAIRITCIQEKLDMQVIPVVASIEIILLFQIIIPGDIIMLFLPFSRLFQCLAADSHREMRKKKAHACHQRGSSKQDP